jgi:hypothetical protein
VSRNARARPHVASRLSLSAAQPRSALSVLVIFVHAGGNGNESRISPRNYGGLLLEAEPVSSPPGRLIVDVTDFAANSALARRYGVLVI